MTFQFGKSRLFALCVFLVFMTACASDPYKKINRISLKEIAVPVSKSQVWSQSIGSGVGDAHVVLSAKLIDNFTYVSSVDGTVSAIEVKSGAEIWSRKMPIDIGASIGVDGQNAYVADKKGIIYALDRFTGKKFWQSKPLGEVYAAPESNDKVVVVRSTNGRIIALDTETGKEVWQYQHKAMPFNLQGSASPVFVGQNVLIGTSGGAILSINNKTGRLRWREPITFVHGKTIMDRIVDVDATPVVDDDVFYVVSMHGELAKLYTATGRTIWSTEYSSAQKPLLSGLEVIITHEDGILDSFSKENGQNLWRNKELIGYDLIGPVQLGKYIVVAARGFNWLFWIDPNTQKIIRKSQVSGNEIISFTPYKNKVLVYSKNGKLSLHQP